MSPVYPQSLQPSKSLHARRTAPVLEFWSLGGFGSNSGYFSMHLLVWGNYGKSLQSLQGFKHEQFLNHFQDRSKS